MKLHSRFMYVAMVFIAYVICDAKRPLLSCVQIFASVRPLERVNCGVYVNKTFQDTGSIIQTEFIIVTRQLLSSNEEKARAIVGSTGRP
jgi:hypothetical protein